ncbi:MAG: 4-carboxy-4-hydroxy-2-oxoadipate aldolase/oxaloacetate decarboxylase [Rhodospirillales bacterium]|nr:4-carboxy-4-hydroxy-2-oxoadipate aldolase/oxaloacetate decarboxylase [Rhodospirillales bacterium]
MAVNKNFPRPDAELITAFRTIGASTIFEAAGKKGAMPFSIKPLYPGMKVCGPALTVFSPPGDNLMLHYAISIAKPGDVLVIDAMGFTEMAAWGDIMATAAMVRGVAGLVIDGCVRDAETLRSMGFNVFARGANMRGPAKGLPGKVAAPIICAGVPVSPGDIVVGDDDGVVIVSREDAPAVLKNARKRDADEDAKRREIRGGKTTVELLGVGDLLKSMGFD